MADVIRGTIQAVPKPREFIKGEKTTYYYSIKVNDTYYSTGSKKPPEPGTLVEFEAEKNARGYWDVTKAGVRVISAGQPTQSVAAVAVQTAKTSHMSKDDYWRRKEERDLAKEAVYEERDRRIELQSCRNSAIAFVELLLKPVTTADGVVNIVKLPAKAKQVEFVEKLVEQYTQQFVEENNKNKKNENNNVQSEVPVEVSAPSSDGPIDPADDAGWDA